MSDRLHQIHDRVTPDDPWYVDPSDTQAVLQYVVDHVEGSKMCTHGHGFTYDFCPIANGNLKFALEHLAETGGRE